jgi:uncharacterized protein
MTLSMNHDNNSFYNFSLSMAKSIQSMINLLEKTKDFCKENSTSEQVILNDSLAKDMFPLLKQIQLISDMGKAYTLRLTKSEKIVFEDNETSIDELIIRLNKTIDIIKSKKSEDFNEASDVKIVLPWMERNLANKYLDANYYLTNFAIPNFYFHVVTAYAILRKNGVKVGKMDYIGQLEMMEF